MRVAIIGSGLPGFYAAEALLRRTDTVVHVDMFDRLPTPYGLVRGGVAPDHQSIKAVTRVYEKTAARPTFRFLGNVCLGSDVTVEELRRHYHQIVYAVGNEDDRRLGIRVKALRAARRRRCLIGWYNGHPDYAMRRSTCRCRVFAVVGNGNVAIGHGRITAGTPPELEKTDVAAHAWKLCATASTRSFHTRSAGRSKPRSRRPSSRSFGEMEDVDTVVAPENWRVV